MHATKTPKAPKHEKHQKYKDATKQKSQLYKRTKLKNALKKHLRGKKVTYSLMCVFVRVKKRKLEKREKSHNGNVLNTDAPTTQLMY